MTGKRVLIVHPSHGPSPCIAEALDGLGFESTWLADRTQIIRIAMDEKPILILLDVPLWQVELEDVLVNLTELRNLTHIRKIVLSAAAGLNDTVAALDSGADDFLVKPISARELRVRIKAVIRHSPMAFVEKDQQSLGDMTLYRDGMEVLIGQRRYRLSPTEYHLLAYLMERSGHVLSREELLENLWLPSKEIEDRRVVDVFIRRLREKIEGDPSSPNRLLTRRGEGYSLVNPMDATGKY
jgi:two-component system response regulator VicR